MHPIFRKRVSRCCHSTVTLWIQWVLASYPLLFWCWAIFVDLYSLHERHQFRSCNRHFKNKYFVALAV